MCNSSWFFFRLSEFLIQKKLFDPQGSSTKLVSHLNMTRSFRINFLQFYDSVMSRVYSCISFILSCTTLLSPHIVDIHILLLSILGALRDPRYHAHRDATACAYMSPCRLYVFKYTRASCRWYSGSTRLISISRRIITYLYTPYTYILYTIYIHVCI